MMGALHLIGAELWGLLVDDELLALGLLVWAALCALALAILPGISHLAAGGGLVAGFVGVLLAAVLRRSART
jgi:hypothetical protein